MTLNWIVSALAVTFFIIISFYLFKQKSLVLEMIKWIGKKYIDSILQIKKNITLQVILVFSSAILIYLASYFPIGIDESYTFLNFTMKGFYSSLCSYPAPNNHVFISLLSNIIYPIAYLFSSPKLIRICTLIISIHYIIFTCTYLYNKYNVIRSILFSLSIFSVIPIIIYSYELRGYVIFIASSSLITILILNHAKHKYFWQIKSICHIISFATNPSWLYSFLVFETILVIKNPLNINLAKKIVISWFFIFSSSFVFYSPIMLFEGLNSLINNPYVRKISNFEITQGMETLFRNYIYLFNDSIFLSILITITLIYTIYRRKHYYLFSIPITILITMVLLKQYPIDRIFIGICALVILYLIINFPLINRLERISLTSRNFIIIAMPLVGVILSIYHLTHDYSFIDSRMAIAQSKVRELYHNNPHDFTLIVSKKEMLKNNLFVEYMWEKQQPKIVKLENLHDALKLKETSKGNCAILYSRKYSNWEDTLNVSKNISFSKINVDYYILY